MLISFYFDAIQPDGNFGSQNKIFKYVINQSLLSIIPFITGRTPELHRKKMGMFLPDSGKLGRYFLQDLEGSQKFPIPHLTRSKFFFSQFLTNISRIIC